MDRRMNAARSSSTSSIQDQDQDQEESPPKQPTYALRSRPVYATSTSTSTSGSPSAPAPAPKQQRNKPTHPPSQSQSQSHSQSRSVLAQWLSPSQSKTTRTDMAVQAPTPVLARHIDHRLLLSSSSSSFSSSSSSSSSPTPAPLPKPKPKPKGPHPFSSASFQAPSIAPTGPASSSKPLRPTPSAMQRSLKTTLRRRFTTFCQTAHDAASGKLVLAVAVLAILASVLLQVLSPLPYTPPDQQPLAPKVVVDPHPAHLAASPMPEMRVRRSVSGSAPVADPPSASDSNPPPHAAKQPSPPPPPVRKSENQSTSSSSAAANTNTNANTEQSRQQAEDLTHLQALLTHHASTLASLQQRLDATDKVRTALAKDLRTSILTQVHEALDTKLDKAKLATVASSLVQSAVAAKVDPALHDVRTQVDAVKHQMDALHRQLAALQAAEDTRREQQARDRRALQAKQHASVPPSPLGLRDLALYTSGARVHHFLTSRTYAWQPSQPDAVSVLSPAWWLRLGAGASGAQVSAHPPEIALLPSATSSAAADSTGPAAADRVAGKCWTSAGARASLAIKLARVGGTGGPPLPVVQVGVAHLARDLAVDFSVAPRQVHAWALVGPVGHDLAARVHDQMRAMVAMQAAQHIGNSHPPAGTHEPPPLVQQPQAHAHHAVPPVVPLDVIPEVAVEHIQAQGKAGLPADLAKVSLVSFTYTSDPSSSQHQVRQGPLVWTLATVPETTRRALAEADVAVHSVAFEVVDNHGHPERSCVYRVGVFAEVPPEYPGAEADRGQVQV